jgi:hypothetical protein
VGQAEARKRQATTVGGFQHAASPRVSSILVLQSTRSSIAKRKEREWMSRDKTCEAQRAARLRRLLHGCWGERLRRLGSHESSRVVKHLFTGPNDSRVS